MSNNQVLTLTKSEYKNGDSGLKVVEVNVSNPVESLYAVCTPVKMK